MKLIRAIAIEFAMVFGIVLLATGEAAAQAPTLTATANGPVVTIQWTSVAGATGYALEVGTAAGTTNLATVPFPASQTALVAAVPPGSYYLRVRATLGTLAGPPSNEAVLTVGTAPPPPPCTAAPNAPSVAATPGGATVLVSWTPVAGAQGYRVEFARTATDAEVVHTVGATTTSYRASVRQRGTFYVRVVAGNTCGQTASATQPFNITSLASGPGPRTADPPPGVLLPEPTYLQTVVLEMANRYAGDLARACKNNHTWLFRLLNELRKIDTRWGLNWKRGDINQGMSSDVLSYNPNDQGDEGNGHVYIFDVIGAECEANRPNWSPGHWVTWPFRGDPLCGADTYCTKWTLAPFLAAGYEP